MNTAVKKYEKFEVGSFIKYPSGKSEFPGRVLERKSDTKYIIEYCISSKDLDNPVFDKREVHVSEIKKMYM